MKISKTSNLKHLAMTKEFLCKSVDVTIERPIGSKHPKWNFKYQCNYGYLPDVISDDGEALDVYVLGINEPIKTFKGRVIAIIHRLTQNDDKLIVVPENVQLSNKEIEEMVAFQEDWFPHIIVRDNDCY